MNLKFKKKATQTATPISSELLPIPDHLLPQFTKVALYHLEVSGRAFADFSAGMIKKYGDKIEPYLEQLHKIALKESPQAPEEKEPRETKTNVDSRIDEVMNSALVSAYAGDMSIVRILKEGVDVNFSNSKGETLLHAAANGWQHRLVELLLIWGANPNPQDLNGDTPLHMTTLSLTAPEEGRFIKDLSPNDARKRTIRELIIRKANCSLLNRQGVAPLHLAAS